MGQEKNTTFSAQPALVSPPSPFAIPTVGMSHPCSFGPGVQAPWQQSLLPLPCPPRGLWAEVGLRAEHRLNSPRLSSSSSLQIRVDGPRGNALQYETVQVVEPGPVLRDMAFSKDHEQLYIMSERQVRLPKFCCTFVLQPKTGRWLRKPTGGRPQRRHVIYLAPCASFPICCLGTEAEPAETGNETLQRAKGL